MKAKSASVSLLPFNFKAYKYKLGVSLNQRSLNKIRIWMTFRCTSLFWKHLLASHRVTTRGEHHYLFGRFHRLEFNKATLTTINQSHPCHRSAICFEGSSQNVIAQCCVERGDMDGAGKRVLIRLLRRGHLMLIRLLSKSKP